MTTPTPPADPSTALVPANGRGICIDCRTLLAPGEVCDGGANHRVAPLEAHDAREPILDAVWGPPDARLRRRQMLSAGGSGAGFALLLEASESCTGDMGQALVVVAVGLIVAGFYWLVTFVIRNIQAIRHRLAPRGATSDPKGASWKQLRGQIVADASTSLSPATMRPCVGYALTLEANRHEASAIMLRHGYSTGFKVALEDGSELEVPAGRLRLTGAAQVVDADQAEVEHHLELDLSARDDLSPVPYDKIREVVLAPGDWVELQSPAERESAPARGAGPYREASWRYLPRGVPRLRRLEEQPGE